MAQEALARGYSRWGRVEPRCHAWVTRVAVNLALDTVRRRKRTPIASPNASAGPTPDRIVLAGELAKLPRRQREVLVLRFLMDLDEKATAQVLGVSIGTVHTHVA